MMITDGQARARVVSEAMTWVGTPYHSHARIKGIGVDCAQFLAAVYESAGIAAPLDLGKYPSEWHIHQSEERFINALQKLAVREMADLDEVRPGDIIVFKYGRCFSHAGIVVNPSDGTIIHSYIRIGVTTHRLDEQPLIGAPTRFFSPWGV